MATKETASKRTKSKLEAAHSVCCSYENVINLVYDKRSRGLDLAEIQPAYEYGEVDEDSIVIDGSRE